MEPVRSPASVIASRPVQERQAGQRQADQFRRALGEEAEGQATEREPERPMRRPLQQRPPIGRKQEGTSMHVDVIA